MNLLYLFFWNDSHVKKDKKFLDILKPHIQETEMEEVYKEFKQWRHQVRINKKEQIQYQDEEMERDPIRNPKTRDHNLQKSLKRQFCTDKLTIYIYNKLREQIISQESQNTYYLNHRYNDTQIDYLEFVCEETKTRFYPGLLIRPPFARALLSPNCLKIFECRSYPLPTDREGKRMFIVQTRTEYKPKDGVEATDRVKEFHRKDKSSGQIVGSCIFEKSFILPTDRIDQHFAQACGMTETSLRNFVQTNKQTYLWLRSSPKLFHRNINPKLYRDKPHGIIWTTFQNIGQPQKYAKRITTRTPIEME